MVQGLTPLMGVTGYDVCCIVWMTRQKCKVPIVTLSCERLPKARSVNAVGALLCGRASEARCERRSIVTGMPAQPCRPHTLVQTSETIQKCEDAPRPM
jgi:hypothetical protein